MTYKEIQEAVIKRYNIKVNTNSKCWSRMHAHVKERMICKWIPKNSAVATFELFHEIGHIETTTSKMRRCESEYYATVWAIERCHEFGVTVPEKTRKAYQDYINRELDRGIRRGGAGYPTDLTLEW